MQRCIAFSIRLLKVECFLLLSIPDSLLPIPVPLLGGVRGGFRLPIADCRFPIPDSLLPTPYSLLP
ncbi:hypothetical protein [Moorena producens]|uniref:hypothetical protein n=1 Tax=Moorena producens TaxID=1155739 RepID=UPI003C789371